MNRELKKRKKRFWVLCLAAVLLLCNTMPMTAMAVTYQDIDDISGGGYGNGSVLYPNEDIIIVNKDYTGSTPANVTYCDAEGNILKKYEEAELGDLVLGDGLSIYNSYSHEVKSYSEVNGPEETGKDFQYWNVIEVTRSGGNGTAVTLQAVLENAKYAITYELNGGSNGEGNPAKYTYGTGVEIFADASKANHTFDGWYTTSDFADGTKVTSISATQTGPVTLYAKFTPDSYAINYELNGGTNAETNPTSYTYGIGVSSFADASKVGHTFDGWYTDLNNGDSVVSTRVTSIPTDQAGQVNLYAQFSLASYDITYHLNGGTNGTGNPAAYTYGTGVDSFADASKTGYTFDGWYTDEDFAEGTKVTSISATRTGAVDLYAKFTADSYKITYHLDNGDNGARNPANYTYGTGVSSLADASKTGYTFDGWYTDANFTEGSKVTSISATRTGAVDLYAKFTEIVTPTATPTAAPTATPTAAPTVAPTATPTVAPTAAPAPVTTPEPVATAEPVETPAPIVKDDVPKTGEGMLGICLFGIMVISGVGVVLMMKKQKKSEDNAL